MITFAFIFGAFDDRISSSAYFIVPDIALQKPSCMFDSINWFSRKEL